MELYKTERSAMEMFERFHIKGNNHLILIKLYFLSMFYKVKLVIFLTLISTIPLLKI